MGSYAKVRKAKRKAQLCEGLYQTIRNTGKALIWTGTAMCIVLCCMLDSQGEAFDAVLVGFCVSVVFTGVGYLLTAITKG